MSWSNTSRPWRSSHSMVDGFFLNIISFLFVIKAWLVWFPGGAVHRSSHPAGLLHASSCSPDVQVPPCLIFFSAFLSDGDPVPTFFPHPALFSPSCSVLSKLRRMEPGAPAARYSQLLDCMCSWGQAAKILELITDWLTQALPKQGVSPAERRPRR